MRRLACHALPHTDPLARLWWRALTACLAVPVGQALVVAAAVRVVLHPEATDVFGLTSRALVDLLVVVCLLWLLLAIPRWAVRAVLSGRGSTVVRTVKYYVAARAARGGADPLTRRVRIPADVDRPDQLLAGLTPRWLAILAAAAVALWTLHLAVGAWVPLPVFAAIATPVAVAAVMVAVGRRDGVSADQFALAGWRHLQAPRRLVPAPDGIPAALDVTRDVATPWSPSPLTLPIRRVTGEAVMDLGRDGAAVLLACTAPDLALWTTEEQDAAVAAWACHPRSRARRSSRSRSASFVVISAARVNSACASWCRPSCASRSARTASSGW